MQKSRSSVTEAPATIGTVRLTPMTGSGSFGENPEPRGRFKVKPWSSVRINLVLV